MNDRVLHVLEYDKVIKKLKNHVDTSLGKELVSELRPQSDIKKVQQMQLETDEASQFIRLNTNIPLGGIYDIRSNVKRTSIGGTLHANECLDIASTIAGSRNVKLFIEKFEENIPLLKQLVNQITILRELEKSINMCIDENGHVIDNASSKLRGIRSSIRTFENRIRERLESFTKMNSNLLSDAIITIRNDRYVLPVKHEHRGTVGGIVHDQSSSGQTLFMEPRAVVDLNNQLREARLQEKQEIDRILRDLSAQIANNKEELLENVHILAEIDFIDARAKLGKEMDAVMPALNNRGIIKMKQARHPLIPKDEVVANDIEIGDSYTSLLITGPNTGGKTVVLKMVGLCTLMAQSGLQVPALDGCELAVFDHVFADIGDEQSIEQNLSTFSSHMTNIVEIMKQVNENSLVLFDELGAGTDPQEGAALAMALLDEVISRDARVIATTHYPELKAYGYSRENVINASVEFNSETLQPTYRLLIGIPGRSNAFDISKQLGLDENIINHAKNHLGIDSKNVEHMIMSLEKSQKQAEKEYEEAHQILLDSNKLHNQIKKEWKNFERERENLYKKAEEKAEKAIQKARSEAEVIVGELREMKENVTFKEHEWIEAKKILDEAAPNLVHKDEMTDEKIVSKRVFQSGDEVNILSLNQTGTILEKINNNEYLVQVGMMRVNIKRKDLELIEKQQEEKQRTVAMIKGSNDQVGTELDIRGERYEEAIQKLEKYIDDSLLAGHPKVRIIHGKGTGALRKAVQELAKSHPHIATFNHGSLSEGGSGITIIELT